MNIPWTAALAMIGAASLFAFDPTGKWSASMPGRNGETATVTFNLKAEGATLTGSVTGARGEAPISDGKISGDNLSFSVIREFNGNQLKQNYTGVQEGNTIHFTVAREGGHGSGGERKFDAKKE